jgi:hypothetical protein
MFSVEREAHLPFIQAATGSRALRYPHLPRTARLVQVMTLRARRGFAVVPPPGNRPQTALPAAQLTCALDVLQLRGVRISQQRIKRRPILGGLINEYERAA